MATEFSPASGQNPPTQPKDVSSGYFVPAPTAGSAEDNFVRVITGQYVGSDEPVRAPEAIRFQIEVVGEITRTANETQLDLSDTREFGFVVATNEAGDLWISDPIIGNIDSNGMPGLDYGRAKPPPGYTVRAGVHSHPLRTRGFLTPQGRMFSIFGLPSKKDLSGPTAVGLGSMEASIVVSVDLDAVLSGRTSDPAVAFSTLVATKPGRVLPAGDLVNDAVAVFATLTSYSSASQGTGLFEPTDFEKRKAAAELRTLSVDMYHADGPSADFGRVSDRR